MSFFTVLGCLVAFLFSVTMIGAGLNSLKGKHTSQMLFDEDWDKNREIQEELERRKDHLAALAAFDEKLTVWNHRQQRIRIDEQIAYRQAYQVLPPEHEDDARREPGPNAVPKVFG